LRQEQWSPKKKKPQAFLHGAFVFCLLNLVSKPGTCGLTENSAFDIAMFYGACSVKYLDVQ
jgi:hypothetical protein